MPIIAGDPAALAATATALTRASSTLATTGTTLDTDVEDLVHDASWSGDAADRFRMVWERWSAACAAFATCVDRAASALSDLGSALAAAERQAQALAATARAAGLPVRDDGSMSPTVVTGTRAAAWNTYQVRLGLVQGQARQARETARGRLEALAAVVLPGDAPGEGLGPADAAVGGDILRSLYTIPAAGVADAAGTLAELKRAKLDLRLAVKGVTRGSDEWLENAALRAVNRRAISAAAEDLARAEGLESKFAGSSLLRTTLGDLDTSLRGGKAGFLADGVPVLGVALAGVATYFQAEDDHEKGWSWGHALLVDGGTNLGGLVAGVAAEAGVASLPFDVPVAASVAAEAVAAYGVGTFGSELLHHGDWDQNIHDHGVVSGIAHSFGDAGSAWWDNDVKGVGSKIADTASSAWRSVFG